MEHLEGLLHLIDKELAVIEANGEFRGRDEIESVYKLIDIAKDVHEIWQCEDEEEAEYSGAMMRDGYAYARGRGRSANRDSMGRYSRNSYRRGGYSRADMMDYTDDQMRRDGRSMNYPMEQR